MDTTHAIACAIQEAARVLGLGVPSYETAESVIGLGHKDMMSRAVPDCTDAIYPAYKAEYWKAYIKEEDRITGLHPGMREMLTAMKDAGLFAHRDERCRPLERDRDGEEPRGTRSGARENRVRWLLLRESHDG